MSIAKPNHINKAIDILEDALLQVAILEQRSKASDPESAKMLSGLCVELNDLITNFSENQEIPL